MTKQQFIETIAKSAKTVCKERGYGYAQYATCCAQACCESGYGQSAIMANANAFFGIKATKSWVNAAKYGGKVYNAKTKECYDGKTYTSISACFRAYNSLDDSVRDYFDLIEGKRYAASLQASSVAEAIKIIHEGGYATSPTYQTTILNFYREINVLIDNVWNGVYNKEEDVKVYYPVLRRGFTGKNQAVKRLQKLLNKCGYGLAEDGIFGPLTDLAVRDYQSKNVDSNGAKLEVDGCVGPKTWSSLNKLEKGA